MTYLLAFALSTSVLVHTALYHGQSLIDGMKKIKIERDDIHAKLMRNYPEVPEWWYLSAFCFFFCVAVIAVEVALLISFFFQVADCVLFIFFRRSGIRMYRFGPCCSLYFYRLSISYLLDSSMP